MKDKLEIAEPKTAKLAEVLSNLAEKMEFSPRSLLIVIPAKDSVLQRAGKNLSEAELILADSLSVYAVLKSQKLIMLKSAIPVVEKIYSGAK